MVKKRDITASLNGGNPKILPSSIIGIDFSNREGITAGEALKECGGDFKVLKRPFVIVPKSIEDSAELMSGQELLDNSQISDDYFVTQREDTQAILGVVKSTYEVIQNTKALEFVDMIEKASGQKLQIESAGCFQNGSRVYLSARLGEHCFDGEQEYVNRMIFTTAHDGSNAMNCFFSPLRVWCLNTLNVAIRQCQNKLTYYHTKSGVNATDWENQENLDNAMKTFELSVKFTDTFKENMKFLRDQKVTEKYIHEFCKEVLYGPQIHNKSRDNKFDIMSEEVQANLNILKQSIEFGIAQDRCEAGTKEWLLNGVTTHLHNTREWRTAEAEFKSVNFGEGQKMTQRAYDYLMSTHA